jgi:hypothetical protein
LEKERVPESTPEACQHLKIQQRVMGMAQVVQCLPTKCETLSSNSFRLKRIKKSRSRGDIKDTKKQQAREENRKTRRVSYGEGEGSFRKDESGKFCQMLLFCKAIHQDLLCSTCCVTGSVPGLGLWRTSHCPTARRLEFSKGQVCK